MKNLDKARIEHIKEAISEIEDYMKDIDEEGFIENSLVRSATVRQLEVIGEAAGALSIEFQIINSKVPWRLWADFRNVLIHQYFGVDYTEVFNTVKNDLPELKLRIEEIVTME